MPGYGLGDPGFDSHLVERNIFLKNTQTGFRGFSSLIFNGYRGAVYRGIKRFVPEVNHSSSSVTEFENEWMGSQWPRSLRPRSAASRWLGDCRFESRRGQGCLSFVSVACCREEVCGSGWSLVQRELTECGVSECDHEASIMRRPWPTGGCCAMVKKNEWRFTSVPPIWLHDLDRDSFIFLHKHNSYF